MLMILGHNHKNLKGCYCALRVCSHIDRCQGMPPIAKLSNLSQEIMIYSALGCLAVVETAPPAA